MRIVFLGSPEEVIAPLQALLSSEHELVGVVSQPAKPAGRKGILTDPPVAQYAKSKNLPLLQPTSARDGEFLKAFADLKPDVAVTAAYGQILSEDFLKIPKRATINIHPSLLPKYRGATPVQTSLLNGDKETGVSVLFTVKKLDAGHIILQKKFTISPDETSEILMKRLFIESSALLLEALTTLETDSKFIGTAQLEEQVTLCKKISKEDGRIDWTLTNADIVNRFRAFTPWPGVYTFLGETRIQVTQMGLSHQKISGSPGVFSFDKSLNELQVTTKSGVVTIQKLKPAGGKEMDCAAFWNGIKSKIKDFQFSSI